MRELDIVVRQEFRGRYGNIGALKEYYKAQDYSHLALNTITVKIFYKILTFKNITT